MNITAAQVLGEGFGGYDRSPGDVQRILRCTRALHSTIYNCDARTRGCVTAYAKEEAELANFDLIDYQIAPAGMGNLFLFYMGVAYGLPPLFPTRTRGSGR